MIVHDDGGEGIYMQKQVRKFLGPSTSGTENQTPQPFPSSRNPGGPAIRVGSIILSRLLPTSLDLVPKQDVGIAHDPPRVDTSGGLFPRFNGLSAGAPPPLAGNDHKPWAYG